MALPLLRLLRAALRALLLRRHVLLVSRRRVALAAFAFSVIALNKAFMHEALPPHTHGGRGAFLALHVAAPLSVHVAQPLILHVGQPAKPLTTLEGADVAAVQEELRAGLTAPPPPAAPDVVLVADPPLRRLPRSSSSQSSYTSNTQNATSDARDEGKELRQEHEEGPRRRTATAAAGQDAVNVLKNEPASVFDRATSPELRQGAVLCDRSNSGMSCADVAERVPLVRWARALPVHIAGASEVDTMAVVNPGAQVHAGDCHAGGTLSAVGLFFRCSAEPLLAALGWSSRWTYPGAWSSPKHLRMSGKPHEG